MSQAPVTDIPALDGGEPALERAGFRLRHFEVFNWGTFHERVWRLHPDGDNMLLTGDIGSGKSTLVDAITTLLVPAQKIAYNKAAGADARERSLRTYVMGHYKSERGETGLAARAVALRDHNSYSVILGVFHNEGFDQTVTLAQVFWFKNPHGQPERFYVVADSALSVAEQFAGFGTDIAQLRKRLRALAGVTLHESFPPYGADFRRRFGIASEQAMDLFHQTVSMKSVGNLTDFVRDHMLEAFPVEARIGALIAHFDDLNRAHEAVLKAKLQIEQLTPLVADCDRHEALQEQASQLRGCREALRPWFARLKGELLEKRIGILRSDRDKLAGRLEHLKEEKRSQMLRRDDISQAIAANGGNRIEQIKGEVARLQATRDERTARSRQYDALAAAVGLPGAAEASMFDANRRAIDDGKAGCIGRRDDAQNTLMMAGVSLHELRDQHGAITTELESLRQRRSNITSQMLTLRAALCEALRIAPDALPFIGELIQVREEERAWEGAAERMLHSFGLSLLVPEAHYGAVAAWVDATNLGNRLVYFRVRANVTADHHGLHPDALARKLAIKPDSPFYGWIDAELARRYDHACCDTLDQFRREKRAVSRNGQVKAGGERHEKDDRHRIDDRSRYVLGWSNEGKIAALAKQERDLSTRIQAHAAKIQSLKSEVDRQNALLGNWNQLATYVNFSELDWRPLLSSIDALEREQDALAASSDLLRTLQQQFAELTAAQATTEAQFNSATIEQARTVEKLEVAGAALDDCAVLLDATPEQARAQYFPLLDALRIEVLGEHTLTVESCENREKDMRHELQARIDAEQKKIGTLRDAIIGAMRDYTHAWPLDAREVDVGIGAAAEFANMLAVLQADDLPRFAGRFKELLNENTIREIAGFQSQLKRERETIRERIDTINASLHQIDYNPNRYIALEAENNLDADLRDFQQDLRSCTEGALTGSADEEYSEAKFLQVKRIIERFRGREGTAEMDKRWTRKVTDVRNWFVFSASERWREDGREHEHYTDAGGKSGGQKEKLAYTVLAASLAYQFGLEWGVVRSRSFRFVVIDEAFGRGSDESARYGLELFKRMNLQLLIVTPLQKIHIIEPYVSGLGFVHSEEGRQSLLRYLTIEQYQAERSARAA
ncbi:ATP-dependent exonuclease SbcCD, C subunit-like protein [Massilia violaceinigra]|uniref:ATP-dependent exonuclease SbcCD, C subunit-like protein n=1 Tax=Massilia violaceinigra TaxID=2045208 RepID=A0ABY4AH27_9BURK|nr:ATP-binding protein [Massilia violaceinigra]UOD32954.1 ATP-dependent exonuclease SbcCD, C subunit-like protein [Massilia violaceinigra]